MATDKYKNIDTINKASSQVRGQHIKEDDRVLIDINETKLLETFKRPGTFNVNDTILITIFNYFTNYNLFQYPLLLTNHRLLI